jgi:hypothetical protein
MNFKVCTGCGTVWRTREDFLSDPETVPIGYQVHFEELQEGFFLFNHRRPMCGTTLSLQVRAFFNLYGGPFFQDRKRNTVECVGYCLHQQELKGCPARCECSSVREVLQIILKWPKHTAA